MTTAATPADDREAMLAVLRRLQLELEASTGRRSWKARIGLADGTTVEVSRVDTQDAPLLLLLDRRSGAISHTTLSGVVRVEIDRPDTVELRPHSTPAARAAATGPAPVTGGRP